MSIPLDRLYNFLGGLCDHPSLLIYRFFPHGSKKLEDLTPLVDQPLEERFTWLELMQSPTLIFHDQEPLHYNLYSEEDFLHFLKEKRANWHLTTGRNRYVASLNLRCCVNFPFNGYDQTLICHSEQNSNELKLYEHGGFIGVYYWSHALIARDWYRFACIDTELDVNFNLISKDFLIYNRAWSGSREYRLTLAEMLADKDLIQCCNVKFAEVDSYMYYTAHVFDNANLQIQRQDLHTLFEPNTHHSSSSANYNNKDYASSAIEVVLETLFDDCRNHLTEKTLRPIACGRPFILAATPGSLNYLKKYGFKTFSGLIDETYDTIQDPVARLHAITDEMTRINQLEPNVKQQLWSKLYVIAKQNQDRFFSDEWNNQVVQEFQQNLNLGITKLTITGKHWFALNQIVRHLDNPGYRTLDDKHKFQAWIKDQPSPPSS